MPNPKRSKRLRRILQRRRFEYGRVKMDELLKRANKHKLGRKVKTDDLICFSLGLLTDEHLEQICNKTLTNKDRLELLFRRVAKERKGLTRDEFFGLLIDGKVTT